MNLPQLPVDKANHFVYGVVLFTVLAFLRDPLFALWLVIGVGILKELFDKVTGTGNPEVWDAVATAAGGAFGFLCTWV